MLLIAAAVLVVALVALAATWQLTRPSANSRADVSVVCASETVANAGGAFVLLEGLDPVTRCAREWADGAVVVGETLAPPLVACARGPYEESVAVTVFPALPGNTCAELGYDAVSPAVRRAGAALLRRCRTRSPLSLSMTAASPSPTRATSRHAL